MDEVKRRRLINERKFKHWEELPNGRKYWYELKGKNNFKAKYVKEVDKMERTIRFYQEIRDENNNLVEIHEKYPIDKGHRKIRRQK